MLQIRLKRDPSADGGGAGKPVPAETVTVACPDHLVLADLPVAKGLGAASSAAVVKVVGRKSRRQLGERVHFCVRCDFPIAIYGRLSPCDHAFCLDCARSDSICYLCDERIQKIQTIKMMEGIFVCAAPHCLKSFMKKNEFESHIHESHSDLLHPNTEKEDGNESEVRSMKQFATVSESTARAPSRPGFSPGSVQIHDREDKARHGQPREQPPPRQMMQQKPLPYGGPIQNNPSESQIDNRSFNRFNQQGVDAPVSMQQEPCQFPEKLHGMPSESPFPEYPPMHQVPQPFMMPLPGNPMVNPPPPFGFPPFQGEGAQPFYGAPYEMVRQDSGPEAGLEQGSLLGFPPVPPGGMNFPANYPQHWNAGMAGTPFEPANTVQGSGDGYMNPPDYVRNAGVPPLNPPPMTGSSSMDLRDGKGILAPQPLPLPPPPPAPPSSHMPQLKRGKFYQGDMGRDGQGFGWQHENQD